MAIIAIENISIEVVVVSNIAMAVIVLCCCQCNHCHCANYTACTYCEDIGIALLI